MASPLFNALIPKMNIDTTTVFVAGGLIASALALVWVVKQIIIEIRDPPPRDKYGFTESEWDKKFLLEARERRKERYMKKHGGL